MHGHVVWHARGLFHAASPPRVYTSHRFANVLGVLLRSFPLFLLLGQERGAAVVLFSIA